MKKRQYFLIIAIFFLSCVFQNVAQASFLYEINGGIEDFSKSDFEKSKDYFLDYTKSNPNDEEGFFWLGKTYLKLNQNNLAKENFKKAYELSILDKNFEKIHNSFEKGDTEDYFDMASAYFEEGKYSDADYYADMIIKINPKSSSAYFLKAKIAQIKGEKEKAVEMFNYAVIYNNQLLNTNLAKELGINEIPKMNKKMYMNFIQEAYLEGDIEKVLYFLKDYPEKNNPDIQNFLLDLYLKTQNFQEFDNLYRLVFLNRQENTTTLLLKAKEEKLKNKKDEIIFLKRAYNMNFNNKKTLYALGNYYLNKSDFKNAQKYFENLININDEFYEGYIGLSFSLIKQGNFDLASKYLRKANQLNSKSGEVEFLLGLICFQNNELNEAKDYSNQAILKSKNAYYYLLLAKIQLKENNNDIARENLLKAQKLNNSSLIQKEIKELLEKI